MTTYAIEDELPLKPTGFIRVREIPFETEEEFRYWWLPELDERGKIIRPARMSDEEKARYPSAEFHNLVTTAGKTAIVNCLYPVPASGSTVTVTAFGQKFAIGNGVVQGISVGDTVLAGEVLRKAITQGTLVGVQIDYSTYIAPSDYVGAITNAGIIGGTSGTDLITHFACTYTKGSGAIAFDYLLNIV